MTDQELTDAGEVGLSLHDAWIAHNATSGGLAPAVLAPVTMAATCAHCGGPIGRCTGHGMQAAGSCGGWKHEDGRHVCFGGEPRKARQAAPAPSIPLGRGRHSQVIVRAPEFRAGSQAGYAHDLGDIDWAPLVRYGRWALGGIMFVAIMVWANLAHLMH